jgi:pseudomonalisin
MSIGRWLAGVGFLSLLGAIAGPALAQVPPGNGGASPGLDRVPAGSVHPLARPELDLGRTDPNLPMERIVLALNLRSGAHAELDRLLVEQQDEASPRFHQWLTPEEFGAAFGLADQDLRRVTDWLGAQGFSIDEVATGRGSIEFSGTARLVEAAFHTEMHDYQVDGRPEHANATVPSIPRFLEAAVSGVVSLTSFRAHPLSTTPDINFTNGAHGLGPADYAVIYDLNPLYAAGIKGGGQSIAIVGRTDIKLSDVRSFRSVFGLPAKDPVFVHNGPDPGIVSGDEGEGILDVEWSGAVAPDATINFVISKSTSSTDGTTLSAEYIVDHNLSPVMSMSFGLCESFAGPTLLHLLDGLFAQAAAQGISVFVSSGDAGAAGCDNPHTSTKATHGAAINGLCSSPNDVCVGGSELNDSPASEFWKPSNNPVTLESAVSYIPERTWNESGTAPGGSGLWSSGGGPSAVYSKPVWQVAPGVPADGVRDTPDVALTAAAHDGYATVLEGAEFVVFSGTSAASPSFAGIMALIVEKTGQRQGNPNPRLYKLGSAQYTGAGPAVFHDVTAGNNSVPGQGGFSAGVGYDLTTGLGSVDASALANAWAGGAPGGPCVASSTTLCIDDSPGDERFAITVSFTSPTQSGAGTAIPLKSLGIAQGGLFWFFSGSNPEMLIKVLNACQVNNSFWVFFAAGTNAGLSVQVIDTKTGHSKFYSNPENQAAIPVQDTSAFGCTNGDRRTAGVGGVSARPGEPMEAVVAREVQRFRGESASGGPLRPPWTTGARVAERPFAAATAARPSEIRPSNASTGFFLTGVSASWGPAGIEIKAATVQNQNASGTSGTLRLELWATATAPVFGSTIHFYDLGPAYVLGPLSAGFELTNVDSGLLTPYAPPPNGCYFVTVALEELVGGQYEYVDLATFDAGGVPDPGGSGFDLFGFGVSTASCGAPQRSCVPSGATLCIDDQPGDRRFSVSVAFQTASQSGNGSAVSLSALGVSEGGLFWFFSAPNPEMLVKIIDGCSLNHEFWFFESATTNVGFHINVIDTQTGHSRTYSNTLDTAAPPVQDTAALPCP